MAGGCVGKTSINDGLMDIECKSDDGCIDDGAVVGAISGT